MKNIAFIGLIVGAVFAELIGSRHINELNQSYLAKAILLQGFGQNWAMWLHVANAVSGASIGYFVIKAGYHLFLQNRMVDPAMKNNAPKHYNLPPWIKPKTSFSLTLGENHGGENYVLNPNWARLPENGLYGNIIAFGGIGSGKTASVANPIMRQIMEYKPWVSEEKLGGLILDEKGDFAGFVKDLAKQYKRHDDLIIFTVGGDVKWNPIHKPDALPETIAGQLVAVYQNITGDNGQGNNSWVTQGLLKLISHCIGILRELNGYVTLDDVNTLVAEIATGEIKDVIAALDSRGDNRETVDSDRLDYHRNFFLKEWIAENGKSRSIFVSALKNITTLFSVPEVKDTFSPVESTINFIGFNQAIDSGKVIVLDIPKVQYGALAQAIGILLKLDFQRAALGRVARSKQHPKTNTKRTLFFVCDEYQKFVTAGGSMGEGDDNFYALSRQSKCFSLVLTQSPLSITAVIGEEKSNVMFASLRSKLFLSLENPKDCESAAETLGKDWQDIENVSFSETLQDANFNPVDASISGSHASVSESRQLNQERRYLIEPIRIQQLKTFEAYASLFNGVKKLPPIKLCLKTDFVPKELQSKYTNPRMLPHNELLKWFEHKNTSEE